MEVWVFIVNDNNDVFWKRNRHGWEFDKTPRWWVTVGLGHEELAPGGLKQSPVSRAGAQLGPWLSLGVNPRISSWISDEDQELTNDGATTHPEKGKYWFRDGVGKRVAATQRIQLECEKVGLKGNISAWKLKVCCVHYTLNYNNEGTSL